VAAQDDFARIRTAFIDPLQHDYEAIRPVVLLGESAAERSRQTGIDRTTIADKAKRFVTDGMLGLAHGRTQSTPNEDSIYPDGIAAYIIYLKQRSHKPRHNSRYENMVFCRPCPLSVRP
jgi:hypothetical protein